MLINFQETTPPGVTLDDIRAAATCIAPYIHRTPVLTSATLDNMLGGKVFIKAENFQRAGAYKIRGALNKVLQLSPAQLQGGLLAWSSGNFAQAVALAAQLVGTKAVILMPHDAPQAKVEATKGYGAEVIMYDRYKEDRLAIVERLTAERGCIAIPGYDDYEVMAGQGTAALELIEDAGELDMLLVPTSGGGLTAGCATALKSLYPDSRVYGVEPEAGNDTKLSLDKGERVQIPVPHTIADGQQVEMPGKLTFEVNRRLLKDVLLVSDANILAAMKFLFERVKVVAEPSGACALAALLTGKIDAKGQRVGVILSGGNVGIDRFIRLFEGFI